MTLRDEAIELSKILNAIVQGLERYRGRGDEYTGLVAKALTPIVAEYDEAVFNSRSREAAAAAVTTLKERMHEVNGAHTKGEIDFVDRDVLNRYWNLHTIFQETRYRDGKL